MNIRFIKSSEKKKIAQQLNQEFGIQSIPYLLIQSGKEKIRAFSGHLSKEEIKLLSQITNIESIGLYLIKQEKEQYLRLSIDATHLFKEQITKNILEINNEQLSDWIRGRDLNMQKNNKDIFAIKHNQDFIGCGKSNGIKIFNYIPKDRRLRK